MSAGQVRRYFASPQHWRDKSGMLGPVSGSTIQKRHEHPEASPAKGHEGDYRMQAERAGTVQHGERRLLFIHMDKTILRLGGTKKFETDSPHWHPVTEQEAIS